MNTGDTEQRLEAGDDSSQANANHAEHQSTNGAHEASTELLIVDGDMSVREMTRRLVEAFGYRALTAPNGEEALHLHRNHAGRIALVITDLDMPGIGGIRMIEQLLCHEPQLRILVVSGTCTEVETEALHKLGVTRILDKPFRADQLLGQIRSALAQPDAVE